MTTAAADEMSALKQLSVVGEEGERRRKRLLLIKEMEEKMKKDDDDEEALDEYMQNKLKTKIQEEYIAAVKSGDYQAAKKRLDDALYKIDHGDLRYAIQDALGVLALKIVESRFANDEYMRTFELADSVRVRTRYDDERINLSGDTESYVDVVRKMKPRVDLPFFTKLFAFLQKYFKEVSYAQLLGSVVTTRTDKKSIEFAKRKIKQEYFRNAINAELRQLERRERNAAESRLELYFSALSLLFFAHTFLPDDEIFGKVKFTRSQRSRFQRMLEAEGGEYILFSRQQKDGKYTGENEAYGFRFDHVDANSPVERQLFADLDMSTKNENLNLTQTLLQWRNWDAEFFTSMVPYIARFLRLTTGSSGYNSPGAIAHMVVYLYRDEHTRAIALRMLNSMRKMQNKSHFAWSLMTVTYFLPLEDLSALRAWKVNLSLVRDLVQEYSKTLHVHGDELRAKVAYLMRIFYGAGGPLNDDEMNFNLTGTTSVTRHFMRDDLSYVFDSKKFRAYAQMRKIVKILDDDKQDEGMQEFKDFLISRISSIQANIVYVFTLAVNEDYNRMITALVRVNAQFSGNENFIRAQEDFYRVLYYLLLQLRAPSWVLAPHALSEHFPAIYKRIASEKTTAAEASTRFQLYFIHDPIRVYSEKEDDNKRRRAFDSDDDDASSDSSKKNEYEWSYVHTPARHEDRTTEFDADYQEDIAVHLIRDVETHIRERLPAADNAVHSFYALVELFRILRTYSNTPTFRTEHLSLRFQRFLSFYMRREESLHRAGVQTFRLPVNRELRAAFQNTLMRIYRSDVAYEVPGPNNSMREPITVLKKLYRMKPDLFDFQTEDNNLDRMVAVQQWGVERARTASQKELFELYTRLNDVFAYTYPLTVCGFRLQSFDNEPLETNTRLGREIIERLKYASLEYLRCLNIIVAAEPSRKRDPFLEKEIAKYKCGHIYFYRDDVAQQVFRDKPNWRETMDKIVISIQDEVARYVVFRHNAKVDGRPSPVPLLWTKTLFWAYVGLYDDFLRFVEPAATTDAAPSPAQPAATEEHERQYKAMLDEEDDADEEPQLKRAKKSQMRFAALIDARHWL